MKGLIEFKRNVEYTQAYGCWLCIQIWTLAIYFGSGVKGRGPRIELCTPLHWFRFSRGFCDKPGISREFAFAAHAVTEKHHRVLRRLALAAFIGLAVGCVPQDALALDCSSGSCGVLPGRRLFVPIARAPVGIFRAGKAIAAHRREKRQAGELPRQKAAKALGKARPIRRAGKALRWILLGPR